jgi:hypothetical protein
MVDDVQMMACSDIIDWLILNAWIYVRGNRRNFITPWVDQRIAHVFFRKWIISIVGASQCHSPQNPSFTFKQTS